MATTYASSTIGVNIFPSYLRKIKEENKHKLKVSAIKNKTGIKFIIGSPIPDYNVEVSRNDQTIEMAVINLEKISSYFYSIVKKIASKIQNSPDKCIKLQQETFFEELQGITNYLSNNEIDFLKRVIDYLDERITIKITTDARFVFTIQYNKDNVKNISDLSLIVILTLYYIRVYSP